MSVYITGVGAYVPENVVSNEDLESRLGLTSDEIYKSSGILRRRWATPNTMTSDLAAHALSAALDDAAVRTDDIDFLIFGTMTPDRFIPGTGSALQTKLQLGEIPCLDVRAACCNMLYGLEVARALITAEQAKNVCLCLAEIQSRSLDLSEKSGALSMLFGDGASALVVSSNPRESSLQIIDVVIGANGSGVDDLGIRRPGTEFGGDHSDDQSDDFLPRMVGQAVIVNASRRIVAACKQVLQRNQLSVEDIAWIVPHQANFNLLKQIARTLDFPLDRVVSVIEDYGNTSSASMGIALESLRKTGSVKKGDNILLPAFGAGFSWGAALCRA